MGCAAPKTVLQTATKDTKRCLEARFRPMGFPSAVGRNVKPFATN